MATQETYGGFYNLTYIGPTSFTVAQAYAPGSLTLEDTADQNTSDGKVYVGDDVNDVDYGNYELVGTVAQPQGGVVVTDGTGSYWYTNTSGASQGSVITVNITDPFTFCFLSATHISTPKGEVLVEDLKISDVISSADGGTRKVLWIGRQVKARFFANVRDLPVEISPGALGDSVPVRPLRLSADHAVLIDGIIAHASALVNNTTIRFMTKSELPEFFTYYHIETDDHALILAEGVASETFVDNVSRRKFDNWREYVAIYGEEERAISEMYYPRAHSQRQLPQRIKDRIGVAKFEIDYLKKLTG